MKNRTKAESLAASLDAWVSQKLLPGLLPETASEAAAALRQQEGELKTLRAALAAKDHIVNVTIRETHPYSKDIRAEFIIADPRIFYAEQRVSDEWQFAAASQDWTMHVARLLTSVGTEAWLNDIREKTYVALIRALRYAGSLPDRAETVKPGSGERSELEPDNVQKGHPNAE